jgi:hypothetical protein
MAAFPFGGDRCRIIADTGKARGSGKPDDPTLEQMQRIVDDRGPSGVRLSDPLWLAGFRIHERKVSNYGKGRVFLAGDAAHIHSPAGGQGMNTGMQDAWGLAWRLALVLQGKARPSLLDSYSSERGAVGEMVLRAAGQMTMVALLSNPVARFVRNNLLRVVGRLPLMQRRFVRYLSELDIRYPGSPLSQETPGGWLSGGARPGDRLPDVVLNAAPGGVEQRLHALLRTTRWTLLLLPATSDPTTLAAMESLRSEFATRYGDLMATHVIVPAAEAPAGASDASVVLDPRGEARRLIGSRESALVLVRPDGYLGYRGQPADMAAVRSYLEQFLVPTST